MKQEIENLIKLQEIDLEIRKIEIEKQKLPERHNQIQEQINEIKNQIEKDKEKLLELQKRKIDIEDEIALENSRLSKSQQKLSTVKTNREYQALLKEIDEIKKGNKQREDEILDLMQKNEEITKDIEDKQSKIKELQNELEKEKNYLESQTAKFNDRYNELLSKRDEITKLLRKDILSKYNFLKEKRGGIAIVEVKNAVCTGCNMNIPRQLFNELLRNDKIHFCPSCQRLIYTIFEPKNDNKNSQTNHTE